MELERKIQGLIVACESEAMDVHEYDIRCLIVRCESVGDAEEHSKARFLLRQHQITHILGRLGDSGLLTDAETFAETFAGIRFTTKNISDPYGWPRASLGHATRPAHIPVHTDIFTWMFTQPAEWFEGWEDAELMADGMPLNAPKGWARRPDTQLPASQHTARTCAHWYARCWRGHRDKCLQDRIQGCWFCHALPSIRPPL